MMFDVKYLELHKTNDFILYGIWNKKTERYEVKEAHNKQISTSLK